ncbi:MAG: hypothetical protein HWD92_06570 [Flavobacteriia bacterium]|nr:hypothetical protein [Flavobacteriia bacterium]
MNTQAILSYLPQAQRHYDALRAYYQNLSFREAVDNAARGRIPLNSSNCSFAATGFDGHQHRIGHDKCREGAEALLETEIFQRLERAQSFEDIMDITNEVAGRIERLGPLWSYDTALRIALHRDWHPRNVYLQTGARGGANILRDQGLISPMELRGRRHVSRSAFPTFLQQYEPYMIEHLLCVAKRENWL